MRLTITILDDNGYVRVRCVGNLTQAELSRDRPDPMIELLGPDAYTKKVLLDLEQVVYVDSSGIGFLIAIHKRFLAAGGELILCSIPGNVMQVFQLLQIHKVFRLRP